MAYRAPVYQGPSYVEEVLMNVDTLSQTFRNVYTQIKDLDEEQQKIESEAESRISERIDDLIGKEERLALEALYDETDKLHKQCSEIADKKIAAAQSSCEVIHGVLKGIDEKILEFEDQLRRDGKWPNDAVSAVKHSRAAQPTPKTVTVPTSTAAVKAASSRRANVHVHPPQGVRTGNTTVVEDLPIDPSEPRYCHCRQVSYGEMIACENPECPYEWFHFQCVGLTEIPSGPWRCADCKRLRR